MFARRRKKGGRSRKRIASEDGSGSGDGGDGSAPAPQTAADGAVVSPEVADGKPTYRDLAAATAHVAKKAKREVEASKKKVKKKKKKKKRGAGGGGLDSSLLSFDGDAGVDSDDDGTDGGLGSLHDSVLSANAAAAAGSPGMAPVQGLMSPADRAAAKAMLAKANKQHRARTSYTPEVLARLRHENKRSHSHKPLALSLDDEQVVAMLDDEDAADLTAADDRDVFGDASRGVDDDDDDGAGDNSNSNKESGDHGVDDDSHVAPTKILNKAAILAARAERERRRTGGGGGGGSAGDDFISLEETSSRKQSSALLSRRLVREDASDVVPEVFDDQRGSRIAFGDPAERERLLDSARSKVGRRVSIDTRWEAEQLRKVASAGGFKDGELSVGGRSGDGGMVGSHRRHRLRVGGLDAPVSTLDFMATLRMALADLTVDSEAIEGTAASLGDRVAKEEGEVEALTSDFAHLSERFDFLQRMRQFTTELADCFDEKIPAIVALEERMHGLLARGARQWAAPAVDSVLGEMANLEGGGAAAAVGGGDSKRAYLLDKDPSLWAAYMADSVGGGEVGRNAGGDGVFPDSDLVAELVSARRLVAVDAERLMEDADEAYSSLGLIADKFLEWKHNYPESYGSAYVDLSVSTVFVPLARLHQLTFDPWGTTPVSTGGNDAAGPGSVPTTVFELPWFDTLAGFEEATANLADVRDGEDPPPAVALPAVVADAFVPLLTAMVDDVWHPTSRVQSDHLRETLEDVVSFFADAAAAAAESANDTSGSAGVPRDVIDLHTAIVERLKVMAESILLPRWRPGTVGDADRALAFVSRLYRVALVALDSVLAWRNTAVSSPHMAVDAIDDIALSTVVRSRLVPFLESAAVADGGLPPRSVLDLAEQTEAALKGAGLRVGAGSGNAGLAALDNLVRDLRRRIA